MQIQPTENEHRQLYAEPADPPGRDDPYAVNLAGLVAFNPTYPELRKTLGQSVEVERPVMLGGPQVTFTPAAQADGWHDNQTSSESVVIKLDVSGRDRVTNRGHDITDQQAAELLGITEPAFARGHELAAAGLRKGAAAMDNPDDKQPSPTTPTPYEVVESPTPQQRLAHAQQRDIPAAGGPNPGIGPHR